MTVQRLVIEGWLPEQIANQVRMHWSGRQKKLEDAQTMVWSAAKQADWRPVTGKARLTITLVFGIARRRDTDNLYSRVKGVCDGLVKGGWIVDDDTEHLELIVRAETRPGQKQTVLTLEAPACES